MGNLNSPNGQTSIIATNDTWIEGRAVEQLKHTAELPSMKWVVGMPDLHPGRGYPIGAAFFSESKLYPALVGNDIGCGMSLYQTELKLSKIKLDKLKQRLGNQDGPLDDEWQDFLSAEKSTRNIQADEFNAALGTIGGGNHFAEFQCIDTLYDAQASETLNLAPRQLLLLVHSGSRGLGQSILRRHVDAFSHQGLASNSDAADAYLKQHDEATRWAELNRECIARRFMQAVKTTGVKVLDVHHNYLAPAQIEGIRGWLHRKGATPSDKGCVVIPGSRGDYSYLLTRH